MTKEQKQIVASVKALYEEHDHAEALLVAATRGESPWLASLWGYHDNLEREIVSTEALLPQDIVEKLKRGDI